MFRLRAHIFLGRFSRPLILPTRLIKKKPLIERSCSCRLRICVCETTQLDVYLCMMLQQLSEICFRCFKQFAQGSILDRTIFCQTELLIGPLKKSRPTTKSTLQTNQPNCLTNFQIILPTQIQSIVTHSLRTPRRLSLAAPRYASKATAARRPTPIQVCRPPRIYTVPRVCPSVSSS